MEGKGKWRKGIAESANTYEGDFHNNKKHGKGTFTWGISGNKYEGNFIEDQREGFGIYKWLNGTVYKGDWKGDKMNGKGIMIFPDGRKQIGIYYKGKYGGKKTDSIARSQILNLIKNNPKNRITKRNVLAVSGDHLLINSKTFVVKKHKRKPAKTDINRSLNLASKKRGKSPFLQKSLTNLSYSSKMVSDQKLKTATNFF